MNALNHPDVARSTLTNQSCPVQYSGRLVDGRHFYFRYRFGRASLAAGSSKTATDGHHDVTIAHGAAFQGHFINERERDLVFAQLMALLKEVSSD